MVFRSIVQYLGGPAKGPGIDVAGAAAVVCGGGILCPGSPGAATAFAPRAGVRRAAAGVAPPLGEGAADGSADSAGAAVARVAALLSAGAPEAPAMGDGADALDVRSGAADAGALGGRSGAADAGALDGRSGAPGVDVALAPTAPDGASRGTNSQ
ncbi:MULTISPECIES: hypothetical protein [Sorangium]|nr:MULTISPECIES: hypothetical protein [Sorangium]